jgi:hypothetical protein
MPAVAQGELYIRPVAALPDGCTPMKADGDHYIVGHSETGHHHVLDRSCCEVVAGPASANPAGMAILYAIVKEPTALTHLRSTDTHAPMMLAPGVYEIRPAREFGPEGWQRVAD